MTAQSRRRAVASTLTPATDSPFPFGFQSLGDEIEKPRRDPAFDAFRGIAILLMVLDHLVLVFGSPLPIRHTLGRLAMPMFFLLAGYLFRGNRTSVRHLQIGLAGVAIAVVVPWIDNPNVLVWWALGCCVLALSRIVGLPVWIVAALGLTVGANGWTHGGGSYDAYSLWGLMALGTMLPYSAFAWARHAPVWVSTMGRHSVAWYLGHLLFLEVAVLALKLL